MWVDIVIEEGPVEAHLRKTSVTDMINDALQFL